MLVASGVSTATRRWPIRASEVSASVTPQVLSKTISAAVAAPGQRVADRDEHGLVGELLPLHATGIDRQHDQRVDALVDQALGQVGLDRRVVGGVDDERLPLGLEQPAPEGGGDALLPDVVERATQHADVAGATERERAGDRIDLIADAVSRLADPLLGLGRHLQSAQRIRDRGWGQAGLGRDVAQRRAPAPVGHAASLRATAADHGAHRFASGADSRSWGEQRWAGRATGRCRGGHGAAGSAVPPAAGPGPAPTSLVRARRRAAPSDRAGTHGAAQ